MSTKSGCTASCCANNQMNEKASNPDKTDKMKTKRKNLGCSHGSSNSNQYAFIWIILVALITS